MSPLLAGTYCTNITPPIGCNVVGGFTDVYAKGILDDLYTNALVFSDGENQAALVSCDILAIPNALYTRLADDIEAASGIPKGNLLFAATHTHSGPAVEGDEHVFAGGDSKYVEHLRAQIITAVRMAQQRLQPVTVRAARGENGTFLFNRRLKRRDGRIVMNWIGDDYLQDVVGPSGLVDPQVFLVRIDKEDGEPLAMIVNYGNHNNAAPNDQISADQAGVMRRLLRRVYGEELGVLFLLGACGNTNWVNIHDPNRFHISMHQRMGRSLAGSVLQLDAVLEPLEVERISIERKLLEILERPYVEYDTTADGCFGDGDETFLEVYRRVRAEGEGKPLQVIPIEITILRLGADLAIVCLPVELFAEFSLEIKAKSPVRYTLVSELTNGSNGYIPTREAFAQGGYEVRKLPGNSWLAVDAGEQITTASLELLAR
jgi:neutral ceramidase